MKEWKNHIKRSLLEERKGEGSKEKSTKKKQKQKKNKKNQNKRGERDYPAGHKFDGTSMPGLSQTNPGGHSYQKKEKK